MLVLHWQAAMMRRRQQVACGCPVTIVGAKADGNQSAPRTLFRAADVLVVEQEVDWPIITAATLMTSAPLSIGFRCSSARFVQSFMRAGIR